MEELQPGTSQNTQFSNATLKVAIGGVLSLLAGLASQVITAYLFGAGSEMDAFFTALTIPAYLQIVLLGGLPFVVIPAFVSEEASGREEDAWALVGTFLWLTGGILLVAATVGTFFSAQIIDLTAPGFGVVKADMATQMLSILMFTIPFIGLGTFTSGVENVRNHFFWPAAATAVGSLGNVITLVVLHPRLGALSLAWGNLASAVLFAGVTTIPVCLHGWKKTLGLKDPRLIEMIRLIAPFIFFGLITNSKLILERYFASGLPDGQLSFIGYAGKISNIFVILLATSIASAIFPMMARAYATRGVEGLVKQTNYGLRVTLALALPAVMISSALAVPLVKMFYERGAFVAATTLSVSLLIPIVMVNDVFFRMVGNMLGRTFFVLKDTLTANLISSLTILFYFGVAKYLTDLWGYWGLALAQPIQAGLAVGVMGLLMFIRIRQFSVTSLAKRFLLYGAISIAAALCGWLVVQLPGLSGLSGRFSTLIQLGAGGGTSVLVYLALLYGLDREIAVSILEMAGFSKINGWIKRRTTPIIKPMRMVRIELEAGFSSFPNLLIVLAFLVDLVTPTLIWKNIIPGNLRWISDGAMVIMIAAIPLRMLVFKNIPSPFWVIVFLSLIGIFTALFTGQGPVPTLWGWWLMFQFPLVGLFAYLQPFWPKSYNSWLIRACLGIMLLEVVVQIGQYLTGTPPGDQLGGTFGQNGTGNLVLFLLLVVCLTMGEALSKQKLIPLLIALCLGLVSSVLGEMKLYYVVIFLIGLIGLIIYMFQGRSIWRVIPIIFILGITLAVFIPVYDAVIPGANELPLESYFTNSDLLTKYLNLKTQATSGGNYYYDLGRNLAVSYGWDKISSNPLNLTLGYGLGARSESISLGIAGSAIQEGDLGNTAGTSALVIIQETGGLGLIILGGFILSVAIGLYRHIRQNPVSDSNGLRYGLILFTLLFPLWLWYDAAWSSHVAMMLYWTTLGFAAGEPGRLRIVERAKQPDAMMIPAGRRLRA
jgi:putative peptidoglycan lipid II flippase